MNEGLKYLVFCFLVLGGREDGVESEGKVVGDGSVVGREELFVDVLGMRGRG